MREVEAQVVRRDDRAGLLDVRAEHFAQRRVQKVRRRVVAPRRVALLDVHYRAHGVEHAQVSAVNFHAVNDEAADGRGRRVEDDGMRRARDEHAGVADLTAGLGVEGRAVEDDLALLALAQFIHFLLTAHECHDARVIRARLFVAGELRRPDALCDG